MVIRNGKTALVFQQHAFLILAVYIFILENASGVHRIQGHMGSGDVLKWWPTRKSLFLLEIESRPHPVALLTELFRSMTTIHSYHI
jgi:hypothetical protein